MKLSKRKLISEFLLYTNGKINYYTYFGITDNGNYNISYKDKTTNIRDFILERIDHFWFILFNKILDDNIRQKMTEIVQFEREVRKQKVKHDRSRTM
jgi:hypothetical protein